VADQAGFLLGISAANIDNASSGTGYQAREASTNLIENNLNWIRGSHSVTLGGSWTEVDLWLQNKTVAPTIAFDVLSSDPANGLFTTANFPGANSTQLGDAGDLYAVLVGSVSAINGDVRLDENTDEYVYLGNGLQRGRMREVGLFISDTWRWRPNLTLNLGLRYELQMPFYPLNNSYSTATIADVCGISGAATAGSCNLFRPGQTPGQLPVFSPFNKGDRAYDMDWNNFAPNVGFAWTPGGQSGFLRTLLGAEGDSVLRAGYSLAYSRNGTSDFSGVFGANPGVALTANRNNNLNNLNNDGRGIPVLFRDRDRLGPPPFPATRSYPLTDIVTGDISIFDPGIQVPYAQSWTAGWQRKLSRDTAVEIRYVGTRSDQGWTTFNYNEVDIISNGFLEEFKLAQANLQANLAAGRGPNSGGNFRYFGPGTGTFPLPTYMAYFSGALDPNNPSSYTSSLFNNNTFLNHLTLRNPNPQNAATELDAEQVRRDNALAAGLPANFLVANPNLLGGANVTGNGLATRFHGMQLELRKRLSNGLQVQGSYSYGRGHEATRHSFRTPLRRRLDTGAEGGVTHAFKANWVYELPFGQGRRFGSNVGNAMNRLIGGWSLDGIARVQSGRMLDFGNVRLVGMSVDELRKSFKLRFDHANKLVFMLPQDIIDNTIRAFSLSATSLTGYSGEAPTGRYFAPANGPDCIETVTNFGDCGAYSLVVTGPRQVRFDMSVAKRTAIVGRVTGEFRAEMLNAFNHPWFTPVASTSNQLDNHRVTGADSGRIVQLIWRVSW
jgi:hypothetical protein